MTKETHPFLFLVVVKKKSKGCLSAFVSAGNDCTDAVCVHICPAVLTTFSEYIRAVTHGNKATSNFNKIDIKGKEILLLPPLNGKKSRKSITLVAVKSREKHIQK